LLRGFVCEEDGLLGYVWVGGLGWWEGEGGWRGRPGGWAGRDVHVLGEHVAGWAAGGVVVGYLDEDLEEVLDYVLDVLCSGLG
jgi:hypothetical protein